MRICIPEIIGRRGAGLGNEMFAWAKAFLASRALGTPMMHPAWGLNRRGYHRDFGTIRLDWAGQMALKLALPVVRFDEAAYRATGKDDYQDAVRVFAEAEGLLARRNFVFLASGMWGGFLAIRQARLFVMAELLKARHALENVHSLMRQRSEDKVLVAVHIRRGDFDNPDPTTDYRGRFNVALPLAWYERTCRSLEQSLGDRVEFLLLTDARRDELKSFIDEFKPLTTFDYPTAACSDLLSMSLADCIVCSVSSFSMWAAFLSQAPYLWFAPNMQEHQEYGSLWGHEAAQGGGGVTMRNVHFLENSANALPAGRGIPIAFDGIVSRDFCEHLLDLVKRRTVQTDLIFYGAVPYKTKPGERL